MALLTITEASHQLGVSVHTLKRRLKRGEIEGRQQATPQGFVWLIEVPDDVVKEEFGTPHGFGDTPNDVPHATPGGTSDITLREVQRMEEFIESLKDEVRMLRGQLETKDRQIGELHVLVQQAQAALPAPKENHRPWWRFWQR